MRVFINFRPEITDPAVAERFKSLVLASKAFDDVTMSPANPAPLEDYATRAAAAISRCDAFIAIVGPGWAERRDGQRRMIDDPLDPVRVEIIAALDRIMTMVPVLVDGATLPDASEITPALQGLALRDFISVKLSTLEQDFPRLLDAVAPGFSGAAAEAAHETPKARSASGLPPASSLPDSLGPSGFRAMFSRQRASPAEPAAEVALPKTEPTPAIPPSVPAREPLALVKPSGAPQPAPLGPIEAVSPLISRPDSAATPLIQEATDRSAKPPLAAQSSSAKVVDLRGPSEARGTAAPSNRFLAEVGSKPRFDASTQPAETLKAEPVKAKRAGGWLRASGAKPSAEGTPDDGMAAPVSAPKVTAPQSAQLLGLVALAVFAVWMFFDVMASQLATVREFLLDAI